MIIRCIRSKYYDVYYGRSYPVAMRVPVPSCKTYLQCTMLHLIVVCGKSYAVIGAIGGQCRGQVGNGYVLLWLCV